MSARIRDAKLLDLLQRASASGHLDDPTVGYDDEAIEGWSVSWRHAKDLFVWATFHGDGDLSWLARIGEAESTGDAVASCLAILGEYAREVDNRERKESK